MFDHHIAGIVADGDEVGPGYGIERLRQRVNVGGNQEQFLDAPLAGCDFGFAADAGAVLHQSFELNVRRGGGINVSASKKNF